MKPAITTLLLACFSASALAAGAPDPVARAKQLVVEAQAKHLANDNASAMTLLEQARTLDPTNDWAMARYAELIMNTRPDEAMQLADQAARANPQNDSAFWVRGWLSAQKQDWQGEAADMTRVTQLSPKVWGAWVNAGHALFQLGKVDEAITMFRGALNAWPGAKIARANLAVAYRRKYELQPRPFDANSTWALSEALTGNHPDDVYYELDRRNPDTHATMKWDPGVGPVLEAAMHFDTTAIEKLLARGADINAVDTLGRTALSYSVYKASSEKNSAALNVAYKLLEWGADPLIKDSDQQTPLFAAILWDNAPLVRALVAAGAPLNEANRNGYTAFDRCVEYCSAQMVAELIRSGGDVRHRRPDGMSLAEYAAENGSPTKLYALLRGGAPLSDVTNPQASALASRVLALAPGTREYELIDAIGTAQIDKAFAASDKAAGLPQQVLDDAFVLATPLDNPGILSRLADAGANPRQSWQNVALVDLAVNSKWQLASAWLAVQPGISATPLEDTHAAFQARLARDFEEGKSLIESANAGLRDLIAMIGDNPGRANSANVCSALFDVDKNHIAAIRKLASVRDRVADASEKSGMTNSIAQLRENRRTSEYPAYSTFSCKFYWTMDSELPN